MLIIIKERERERGTLYLNCSSTTLWFLGEMWRIKRVVEKMGRKLKEVSQNSCVYIITQLFHCPWNPKSKALCIKCTCFPNPCLSFKIY